MPKEVKVFTEDKNNNLYTSVLGATPKGDADAIVKTGGTSITKFVPNINASKWNDECWLNINNKAVDVKSEKQSFVDGKVELIVGNDCHRYYIDAEGRMNYDIIFSSIPKPEILFDLQFSRGLDFFYQPELTLDEIAMGENRPDDIIGSYAVFGQKAYNKYQTGKVCHIRRPKFIDSEGNWIWGTLFIDPSANMMSIRCDEKWLKNAVYPITLDPTFGWSTAGGSNGTTVILVGFYQVAESGTVTEISVDLGGSQTDNVAIGYYGGTTSAIGTHIAHSASTSVTTTSDHIFYNFSVSGLVTGGTSYWLVPQRNLSAMSLGYDSTNSFSAYKTSWTYNTWSDNPGGLTYRSDYRRIACYATYTATAAGLSVPVAMANYRRLRA